MFEYQGAAIPWLFEVSSDGQYIAVLHEAALEVFCVYFSNMGKLHPDGNPRCGVLGNNTIH